MAFENSFNSKPVYYSGRHLPVFAQATTDATINTTPVTPMTPNTAEVVVLTTGAWYPGWNANTWTPIPSFEEQWALTKTPEERASLLAFYSPTASLTFTHYQRSILMSVALPATKSDHPDAELTFCDGTLRKRVCDFAYCVEDSADGAGYWYCDACRNFANQQEQEQEEDDEESKHKFGLCPDCDRGLDDESEFTLHTTKKGDTIFVCHDCVFRPLPPWMV
jgi:hypothetical protein